ncbi:MAG: tetratricopeptide repeat protein [Pseudoclavibacter sp.]|jgi:tetratricopeptide (TPR) repeat protein
MNAQPQRHLHSVPEAGAPEPLWLQIAEAASAGRPRDHTATLRLFTALLGFMPAEDPRTLYYLGHAYAQAGNPVAASSFLEFALKKGLAAPVRGQAYLELASALRHIDRVAAALEWLDAGIADPANAPFADALTAYQVVILHDSEQYRAAAHAAIQRLAPHLDQYIPDSLP